jgi:hypothetical protein
MNLTFQAFTAAELNSLVADKSRFPLSTNSNRPRKTDEPAPAFEQTLDSPAPASKKASLLHYFAALDVQGQPVGVLAFRQLEKSANIEFIETAVYHRNEGIAPKLTQAFLEHAKAEGLTVATSNVDPSKNSFLKRLMAKAATAETEVSR